MRIVATLLTLLAPIAALAEGPVREAGNFGIGLGGGLGPVGISAKYFMGDQHAIQGMVGTYARGGGLGLGADYLFEGPAIVTGEVAELGWNVGAGPQLYLFANTLGLAATGVAGLEVNFQPVPIDVVIEYRPGILIIPVVGADLVNFSGHVRYYF